MVDMLSLSQNEIQLGKFISGKVPENNFPLTRVYLAC